MAFQRSSGIILHPTSLPGPDGIGDLGPEAFHWIDFLSRSGCKLWQILPLGPTGYGDSPYQCFSAFAGNPYLINSALLLEQGLLSLTDLTDRPDFPVDHVDFGPVISWKLTLLTRAYLRFKKTKSVKIKTNYQLFCEAESYWLDDFALFMAIKESQGGVSWDTWPLDLRLRESKALVEFTTSNLDKINEHKFRQFIFFTQWLNIKKYANSKGIQILGDIPIFISFDSADAWSNPELFFLNKNRKPIVVAGVPPDYFSPTGQLWGNPLYKWAIHKKQGYSWWINRIKAVLQLVDIIRLDHFRGFAGYWEIPYGKPTAEIGRWVKGPGISFFSAIKKTITDLPLIAEDLGLITKDVVSLRDTFNFPGMKILQFAFGSTPADPFLPHNYPVNCVAYTGTHDNDTTRGWYDSAPANERDLCRRYLGSSGEEISWNMIRAIWQSPAAFALAPLQDFLSLDTQARMNFPGKASGNWSWRYRPDLLSFDLSERIQELNFLYSR
jgi:4-alpha-glucanotransferase